MNDTEAIAALATLRIRIDGVLSDTQAIEYTLASYGINPLRAVEAVNSQMEDQAKMQQEHFTMQSRAERPSTSADVRARIEDLQVRVALLGAEKKELLGDSLGRPAVETGESDSESESDCSIPGRTHIMAPRALPLSTQLFVIPERKRPVTTYGKKNQTKPKTVQLPPPPSGFSNWTDAYHTGNMPRLARAQSRASRGKNPVGKLPTMTYGNVRVREIPCQGCHRLDIPCLMIHEERQRAPPWRNQRCVVCQEGKGYCADGESTAKKHPFADAVAKYHNTAISRDERPGMWMGPGVPALDPVALDLQNERERERQSSSSSSSGVRSLSKRKLNADVQSADVTKSSKRAPLLLPSRRMDVKSKPSIQGSLEKSLVEAQAERDALRAECEELRRRRDDEFDKALSKRDAEIRRLEMEQLRAEEHKRRSERVITELENRCREMETEIKRLSVVAEQAIRTKEVIYVLDDSDDDTGPSIVVKQQAQEASPLEVHLFKLPVDFGSLSSLQNMDIHEHMPIREISVAVSSSAVETLVDCRTETPTTRSSSKRNREDQSMGEQSDADNEVPTPKRARPIRMSRTLRQPSPSGSPSPSSSTQKSNMSTRTRTPSAAGPSRITTRSPVKEEVKRQIKSEGGELTLSSDLMDKYLNSVPPFIIDPNPTEPVVYISRKVLHKSFRGSHGTLETQILAYPKSQSKSQSHPAAGAGPWVDAVFPQFDYNPLLPDAPGAHGLMFSARTFEKPLYEIFCRRQDRGKRVWRYMGQYRLRSVGTVSGETWKEQTAVVKNTWAEHILARERGKYFEMRKALVLKLKKDQVNAKTGGAKVKMETESSPVKRTRTKKGAKAKAKAKAKDSELSSQDIIDALCSGEDLAIGIVQMRCVGYDHAFADRIRASAGRRTDSRATLKAAGLDLDAELSDMTDLGSDGESDSDEEAAAEEEEEEEGQMLWAGSGSGRVHLESPEL
ncbi:hypothetical protein C8F01DRAFT_1373013 [Mycena amicta]|nr:hypothetical protein C8F01DRAFT_1373013 [Mycena amicta]